MVFANSIFSAHDIKSGVNKIENIFIGNELSDSDIVAIAVPRSFYLITAIISCLDAGITYLLIDINAQPKNRIEFMLNNADINTVLSVSSVNFDFGNRKVLFLDDCSDTVNSIAEQSPMNNLAYILYTSGTTGTPKAVEITKKGLSNFIESMKRKIGFSEGEIIASFTNCTFDIFFLEAIVPLYCGMTVRLATEEQIENPMKLVRFLKDENTTVLQTTPSRLRLLKMVDSELSSLNNLKIIMVGGEPFPAELLQTLQKIHGCKIFNMYGPTETTIWSTIADLSKEKEIHIGTPIDNTSIYLLKDDLTETNENETGEICIGGDGLANGYYNNAIQTEENFKVLPFAPYERVYRTGDLGYYNINNHLIYCGRKDSQVKINGKRVELEEIEVQINNMSEIKQAVVCFDEEKSQLISFYLSDNLINELLIKENLNAVLPKYMIPIKYIRLNNFFYTVSGKIDRKKLLDFFNSTSSSEMKEKTNNPDGDEITNNVINLVNKILNTYEHAFDLKAPLVEIGFDSMNYISFIVELENIFDIEIEEEKLIISSFENTYEVINYIRSICSKG